MHIAQCLVWDWQIKLKISSLRFKTWRKQERERIISALSRDIRCRPSRLPCGGRWVSSGSVDWRGDTTPQRHGLIERLGYETFDMKEFNGNAPETKGNAHALGIRLLSGINQQATNVTICAHVDINSAWIWFLMEEISTFKSVMCLTCHDKTGSVFSSAMEWCPFLRQSIEARLLKKARILHRCCLKRESGGLV